MKKTPVRRLWGKGKGRFRTRGRYSSGTVRGTNWITTDFCDGTDTRVVAGIVRVYDLVAKKWILLKAGESYFAKAGRVDLTVRRGRRARRLRARPPSRRA